MKLTKPSKEHMEKHYADLANKKFFPGLIEYMTSGPVCAMVWEGKNAVLEGRKMLGATMPSDSAMGTIRGDFCIEVGRNICHGSDAVESANHEIGMWFPEGVCEWTRCDEKALRINLRTFVIRVYLSMMSRKIIYYREISSKKCRVAMVFVPF